MTAASKLARSAGKNDRGQLGLPPATAPVIDMLGPQLTWTPAGDVGQQAEPKLVENGERTVFFFWGI